ncbi:MAG: CsbD-like [Thermoleophilia bacterium]|nr:CsbD-like [Thermoleophilia bacterium]
MGETTDKLMGRAKETAGAATGNDDLKARGEGDQAKGEVKGKVNDAVDKVGDVLGGDKDKHDH